MKKENIADIKETETLEKFHYKQELKRSLKFFSVFAFAFSAISLTTGIFLNFGFVMQTAGPIGIWTFPIVGIGSLLVAIIFGEISTHVPVTGHCYMWVSKLHSKGMGWMIGWINFCYLIIILPSINTSLSPIVASVLGIPSTPVNNMIIAEAALTLQLLLNIFSIKISSLINSAATLTESIGVVLLTIVLVICAFHSNAPVSNIFAANAAVTGKSLAGPLLMCFLLGFYTLVGFESAANMSEETTNARHNVPKAMITAIGLSTLFGTLLLIAATFAIKNLPAVVKSASPLPLIIESNLGPVVGKIFMIVVIISIFACGLVFMTSASRTVFAMSRDNAFFASGLFKKVSKRTSTPIPACILFWVIGTCFLVFSTPTILAISSSALPSLYYLLTIVCYALVRKNLKSEPGTFNLGKWGMPLIIIAIAWLVFGFSVLSLPADFRSATVVNFVLIGIGLVLYFAYFRKKISVSDAKTASTFSKADNVISTPAAYADITPEVND